MSIYLGIDIGTSSTKTLAMNEQGEILAEAAASYPLSHPKPLWSEQDPDHWWHATVKTVQEVVASAEVNAADVKAIGLSGQMHGSVFLDAQHQVIRPALLWNDQRTAAECDEIESAAGGREALIQMVANPALTGFTAPKVLWLRNHEPENYEKLARILLPKDDVRRRLTGEYMTEVSDASGMLLLDVAKRNWSDELLSKLKLNRDMLAPVVESADITGKLLPEVADQLGLSSDVIVVGGAGDCAAGGVGTGVVSSGTISTSLGTSGIVFAHSDEVKIDPKGRLHTFCHAVRGKWHMMGVSLTGGGAMQWYTEKICQDISQANDGADPYEILGREAAAVPPGSEGLFFLPYLAGERTPHADPDARACLIGMTLKHERGHLARAIMEGVCYALRDSLAIIQELGVPTNELLASGGGARSAVWRQIQANVLGQTACTINAEQGPAYGVALLAAVGDGAYSSVEEACDATIHVIARTEVQAAAAELYTKGFEIYQSLYRNNAADFRRISALAVG
jgi:xylulokinase